MKKPWGMFELQNPTLNSLKWSNLNIFAKIKKMIVNQVKPHRMTIWITISYFHRYPVYSSTYLFKKIDNKTMQQTAR